MKLKGIAEERASSSSKMVRAPQEVKSKADEADFLRLELQMTKDTLKTTEVCFTPLYNEIRINRASA